MNHDPQKLQAIARWLADLADMTKGGREPPTAHKIALYTGQLAEIFPSGAFTHGSLRAVCFEQEYFPAFDVVRARVRQWWHENMPSDAPLIEHAGRVRLEPMDEHWVRFYYKRRAEISQSGHDHLGDHPDPSERAKPDMGRLESLIMAQSPKGWANITGIETEPFRREPTTQERAAVARAVERVVEGVAR